MRPFTELGLRGQVGRLRELARTALQQWTDQPQDPVLLQHGENSTFRVRTGPGSAVLRIHRPPLRTAATVRSELQWLTALRSDTELVVPEPVPTRSRDTVVSVGARGVPEQRLCVLLRWVPGRFRDANLTPANLFRVGELTGRLQNHADSWPLPTGFVRPRLGLLTETARAEEAGGTTLDRARANPRPETPSLAMDLVERWCSAEDARTAAAVLDSASAVRNGLGTAGPGYGLIHGDLHQENYLFDAGRIGVIDFDDCGFGHRLDDLAVTLSELTDHAAYPALRASLLAGYRTVRPLPPSHEPLLDPLIAFRFLQIAVWQISLREHPGFRERWHDNATGLLRAAGRLIEQ